ncbi:MAG: hypothetical protein VXX00_00680, partial [Pseudomonadota bacterium]|nr:hypothetical protein [Pseudomonadota bacterium]
SVRVDVTTLSAGSRRMVIDIVSGLSAKGMETDLNDRTGAAVVVSLQTLIATVPPNACLAIQKVQ